VRRLTIEEIPTRFTHGGPVGILIFKPTDDDRFEIVWYGGRSPAKADAEAEKEGKYYTANPHSRLPPTRVVWRRRSSPPPRRRKTKRPEPRQVVLLTPLSAIPLECSGSCLGPFETASCATGCSEP
jgi:hypothetical protein